FRQPRLLYRKHAAVLAWRIFEHYRPLSLRILNPAPYHSSCIAVEARRRGIPVTEVGAWRHRANSMMRWPGGIVLACGFIVHNIVQALRRTLRRQRLDAAIEAASSKADIGATASVWVAVAPAWPQVSLPAVNGILIPFAARGVELGLLFEMTYGEVSDAIHEISYLPGVLGRFRPAAVGQVVGASTPPALLRTLAVWFPRAVSSVLRAIRHCDRLDVAGMRASSVSDMIPCLR